jgi:hypothetical protein
MKNKKKHPMQQIHLDKDGVARFRANKIVRYLLDAGPFDMNQLALISFSNKDREQFAQLIGYSVSGYGDLGYASPKSVAKADAKVEKLVQKLVQERGDEGE